MHEIPELDIILSDEGWDKFDGKSYNVWGDVPFPEVLLNYLNEFHDSPSYFFDALTGKKIEDAKQRPSVWTAFDDYIYSKFGKKIKKEDLPRISATFKSSFNKYNAIAENIGMKLAMALDMPTSYNYIVSFDPNKYPQIVDNYPTMSAKKKLFPYGIVSIDFLQNKKCPTKISTADYEGEEIPSISEIEGDELITFEDALYKYRIKFNKCAGEQNLIENWIEVVDEMARREFKDQPREYVNRMISHIHSRIARSCLLKEGAGDCDFTGYNGGVVCNKAIKKMRYAPNHDYGECFNALIKYKLEFDPLQGMTQELFDKQSDKFKASIMATAEKVKNMTLEDVARTWASSTSEENFYYVIRNFPKASKEFFENIDQLIQKGHIEDIINPYSEMTCNGVPLLTPEEVEMFKSYLYGKLTFMCEKYVEYLRETEQEIPNIAYADFLQHKEEELTQK